MNDNQQTAVGAVVVIILLLMGLTLATGIAALLGAVAWWIVASI